MVSAAARESHYASGTTLGGAIWIGIIAITPIHRLVMTYGSVLLPYFVLGVITVCTLLGKLRRPPGAQVWLFALCTIPLAAVVSGTSSAVVPSMYVGIKLAAFVGLTPFILRYYATERDSFTRYALAGFLGVQSVSALVGIMQLSGTSVLGLHANAGRANGLAAHPNVLGLMATIAILVGIFLAYRASGAVRWAGWVVIMINTIALVGSGSLSSMISLGVGCFVLLLAMRVAFKSLARVAIGVAVCSGIALTVGYDPSNTLEPVQGRVDTVLGITDDGVASLSIRQSTYEFAEASIRSDPVTGVGMDSMHQGTFNGVTVVHNYLLRAWYQGGLLLFLTVAAISVLLIVIIAKSMMSARNEVQSAVIATVIAFGMTSAFYDQQQYWLPVLLAVAAVDLHLTGVRRSRRAGPDESASEQSMIPKEGHR
ncbi:O-antigen ligase family protein [Prescottella subtropica]|uniref:O-antigen ligase family protein n=1 Tax=Prescottella subtropica TaxID=2545757 RepID=UPI001F50142A|nr:O-antigen ligase family protein [Prescottella subtropica]